MLKNLFLYISLGFILVSAFDHSLLKSQKIDCANGYKLACDYLEDKN